VRTQTIRFRHCRRLAVEVVTDVELEHFYPIRRQDRAGQRTPPRPLRCSLSEGIVFAHPAALPFPDASFDAIDCLDQLELIRREEDLLAEFVRVLRPGGTLTLRVPATGPLAGFDSFNLSRYLVDASHHGFRPPEPSETGWRKHYSENDLTAMLAKADLTVTSMHRSRFIISELLEFIVQTRFRWWKFDPRAYHRAHRKLDRVRAFEDRLHIRGGFLITVVAGKPSHKFD
jgi:SAM-dependent methyltransferase